jgi:CII-binding regulator of phage lambda lysogenization HflD
MTLTNKDFKALDVLLDQKIEEKAETLLVTKDEINHLPTKEEFYDREDKVMSELKAIREEITTVSGLQQQVHDNEERLIKVEKKLNIQPVI